MSEEQKFLAHIRANSDGNRDYQTVEEHLKNTAEISQKILAEIGLGNVGYITGILHDMGKYKTEFQTYIMDSVSGVHVRRGSVTHSFSGAKYILENYHPNLETRKAILAETVAIAIASHHGLFDIEIEDKCNGFDYRLANDDSYEECVKNFYDKCMVQDKLNSFIDMASNEFSIVVDKIAKIAGKNGNLAYEDMQFYMAQFDRLILSALIEGDRRDTAQFMNPALVQLHMRADFEHLCKRIDSKIMNLTNKSNINAARRQISDICAERGNGYRGIYRLNVPTGGGKTLSSLRFAIHHAKKQNMKRIIFCTPLLAILEQNAAIIREYIGDDSIILEHHSNVLNMKDDNSDQMSQNELLMDNWDSPIIITTLVQLLNTFFSGRTSSIRRYHSLINSVIVIDEVQTVPVKMLSLFNLAVNFLCEVCGATIVLSSATQPSLAKTQHQILGNVCEMVPYDKQIWDVFKRTEIKECKGVSIDKVATVALDKLRGLRSILIICNKKEEARKVYQDIKEKEVRCLHLSASMCMEHRRDVLKQMRIGIEEATIDAPFICVSTQVIEAGVDISFECVIRFMAGMDSVVQAAGRCNRNGENKYGANVYVINVLGEKLDKLLDIKRGKDATQSLLLSYNNDMSKYDNDLISNMSIRTYYELFYRQINDNEMDYYVREHRTYLLDMLGVNSKWAKSDNYYHHQAFKTAGECFEVFDSNVIDVIVPYGRGKDIIESMNSVYYEDVNRKAELIKDAKQFTVSIYDWQRQKMEKENILHWCMDGMIAYVTTENYDDEIGLVDTRKQLEFMEV